MSTPIKTVWMSGQSNLNKLSQPAHALTTHEILEQLNTIAEDGLTEADAKERQTEYGLNKFQDGDGVNWLSILLCQVANAMTMVRAPTLLSDP
jgi:P-type Na+/K+ transporter